jgi:cell division initiation protein
MEKEAICMRVTSLEIRQEAFPLRFRGYDPTAVDMFLELVAGQLEDLVKENAQLSEALESKNQEIQRMREEGDWKKALMAVQETSADLIRRAEQQAQSVLAAAKLKAQQLLRVAEQRRQAADQDVRELEFQRRQLLGQIRGFLEQHLPLLEAQQWESDEQLSGDGPGPLAKGSPAPEDTGEVGGATKAMDDLVDKGTMHRSRRPSATAATRGSVP